MGNIRIKIPEIKKPPILFIDDEEIKYIVSIDYQYLTNDCITQPHQIKIVYYPNKAKDEQVFDEPKEIIVELSNFD